MPRFVILHLQENCLPKPIHPPTFRGYLDDVAPRFVARAATWFPSTALSTHRNTAIRQQED